MNHKNAFQTVSALKRVSAIVFAVCLLLLPSTVSVSYAGDTLKNIDKELHNLIDSCRTSIVTVSSQFSREILIEKDSGILSFFKTEIEKKALPYTNIGTGIIFDDSGYILTRSSIVLGSERNTVTLADGTELPAELRGYDPETGFAVLKVDKEGLVAARLGNSDHIRLGSWNLIIGNSFGVYPSIVFGAINGIRDDGMLQISANLNPGNNGSPIISVDGKVIGLVAGLMNADDGLPESVSGYQFSSTTLAYPINWIRRIAEDIIQYGEVRKGWLGVVGYHEGKAAKIREIKNDSPAEKAGFREGDVIVKFANKRVNNISELARLVEYTNPGETVAVELVRNGKIMATAVEIGKRKGQSTNLDYNTLSEAPVINENALTQGGTHKYPLSLIEKRIDVLEKELQRLKKLIEAY